MWFPRLGWSGQLSIWLAVQYVQHPLNNIYVVVIGLPMLFSWLTKLLETLNRF